MTFDEAVEVLRCSRTADWAAVQRQYDEQYNELQRLREVATTREERQEYVGKPQAVETAYAFLKAMPGFGPVTASEPELRQTMQSPYQADRVAREALQGPRQSADVRERPRKGYGPAWDRQHWRFLLLALLGVGLLVGLGLVVQQLLEQQRLQQAEQDRLKQQVATQQAEADRLYYSKSPPENPPGPSSGAYRVFRGGGWDDDVRDCRSANRVTNGPTSDRDGDLGFRLLMEVP